MHKLKIDTESHMEMIDVTAGIRLLAGLLVTVLGVVITYVVIASGHNSEGLQGVPVFSWPLPRRRRLPRQEHPSRRS